MEKMIGNELSRVMADAGYRGLMLPKSQAEGLHQRPEAPPHARHQTPDATTIGGRTRHWTPQERTQNGPELSRWRTGGCHQCRSCRRRIQLLPPTAMVQATFDSV